MSTVEPAGAESLEVTTKPQFDWSWEWHLSDSERPFLPDSWISTFICSLLIDFPLIFLIRILSHLKRAIRRLSFAELGLGELGPRIEYNFIGESGGSAVSPQEPKKFISQKERTPLGGPAERCLREHLKTLAQSLLAKVLFDHNQRDYYP